MKTPRSGREISKKWLEYILREHKAATDSSTLLQVDNFTVRKDLGDGYNSQVIFFNVETTEKNEANSPDVKKTYSLVAKLLNEETGSRVFATKFKINLKEYLVYTDLINTFNKILTEKAPEESLISLPKLIYGKCTKNDFVLVMENVENAGYETNDKCKGLDSEQLMATVDKIARIHALSYVFCETSDTSKYLSLPRIDEYFDIIIIMIEGMLENTIDFLKSSKETEELGKKIKLSLPSLKERTFNLMSSNSLFKCIIHGDFWNNNFMFKYADTPDEQRIIEDIMVIDWGNSSWGVPLFDLQYLIYSSTQRCIRKEHLDKALSHYHSTFTTITTKLGCPLSNWGLTELKTDWEKGYPVGFLLSCTLVLGTLSTTNPFSKRQISEPSILDKPFLLPVTVLLDAMKLGMAKVFMALTFSLREKQLFKKVMKMAMKKLMTPILEELKSGKNEAMNTRILDLIYEADENGLFST